MELQPIIDIITSGSITILLGYITVILWKKTENLSRDVDKIRQEQIKREVENSEKYGILYIEGLVTQNKTQEAMEAVKMSVDANTKAAEESTAANSRLLDLLEKLLTNEHNTRN